MCVKTRNRDGFKSTHYHANIIVVITKTYSQDNYMPFVINSVKKLSGAKVANFEALFKEIIFLSPLTLKNYDKKVSKIYF